MKNVLKYLLVFILVLTITNGCEDNKKEVSKQEKVYENTYEQISNEEQPVVEDNSNVTVTKTTTNETSNTTKEVSNSNSNLSSNVISRCAAKGKSYYIINFDSMGGSKINQVSLCRNCKSTYKLYELPTPTKVGYKFEGWYSDSKLTTKITGGYNTIIDANWTKGDCNDLVTTIYAKWTKVITEPEYACPLGRSVKIVNYNTNGGNNISRNVICTTCVSKKVELPTPTRDGYTFEGWYADPELTKKVTSGMNNVVGANWTALHCNSYSTTLYAKWTPKGLNIICKLGIAKAFVNFDTNGGNEISRDVICRTCVAKQYELPIPKRDGYKFAGWYADSKFTKPVTGGKNTVNGAVWRSLNCDCISTTIYAKWEK